MRFPGLNRSAASPVNAASKALTPSGETKANVFISYSRKDLAFVDRLATALEGHGIAPSIDRTEIYAFEDWWKRIEALIGAADTIVFVLSPDALASEICQKEVSFAVAQQKRIAPIVCRPIESDHVPVDLAKLNFIFFDDPERFDAALAQLIEALATDIGWMRQHTAFALNAQAWESAGRPNGLLLRSPRLEEAELWIATRPQGAPLPTDLTNVFIRESRRATTRRRNILTGSLASGLVVALVLAGLALWQREKAVENEAIAKAQRDRAETTLRLATGTANGLVFDLAQKLRDVAGIPNSLVKDILDRAVKLQNDLTSAGETSPDLRRSQAAALDEIAGTLLTLGDTADALAAEEKARDIAKALAESDRSNTLWQRDLSVENDNIGDVLVAQGKLDAALAAYREGNAIIKALAASDKSNTQWQNDLAASDIKIGDVLVAQGQLDAALAAYSESSAIRKALALSDKSNTLWQRNLSVSDDNIGHVLQTQGQLDAALAAYREAYAIRKALAESNKSNTLWQHDLSLSDDWIGNVLQAQSHVDAALAAYREAYAIRKALAESNKSNTLWQRDLSVSDHKIGDVLKAQGKLNDALKFYKDGLNIIKALLAQDASNTQWQNDLSFSIGRIGGMAGWFNLAREFPQALDAADFALSLAPDKILFYIYRAHALMFLGRTDEARTLYLAHRGEKAQQGEVLWEKAIEDDFAELRKAGVTNPLMDEIERDFASVK
ncbi:MAG: TIR domain-containing protein [Beijerinckiaceae bacterium]